MFVSDETSNSCEEVNLKIQKRINEDPEFKKRYKGIAGILRAHGIKF